jgi:hypothetical protein
MDRSSYDRFTAALQSWAELEPVVIGLIAAGSAAGNSHDPDEWSDHDFWVVTSEGAAEPLRRDLGWLPYADRIAMTYRETEHGVGAVYDDGHLVEVAVFTVNEMTVGRLNDYRVLSGDAEFQSRLVPLMSRRPAAEPADEAGRFLAQLLIGLGRHGRGEDLSAHAMVRARALETLLGLIAAVVPPETSAPLDDLDRHRRFEAAYPSIAPHILALLRLEVPGCAEGLIDVAERTVAPRMSDWPVRGVDAVRRVLARAALV